MYGSVVHVPFSCCSASAMSIKRARQRMPSSIEAFIVDECVDEDEVCVDEDEGSTAAESKVDECVDEDEGVHEDEGSTAAESKVDEAVDEDEGCTAAESKVDEAVDEDEGCGTGLQGGDLLGGQLELEGRAT